MPKEFTLEGGIGWDIGTWDVKNMLREANGEDILVNFASPGGSVFTGLKIFNLFKLYKGNVDFHLIGEAASMGSYIPLAGRKITAEPNVVYMIHNARSFVGGDHNDLRKVADLVEGLSGLLRNEYMARTGKSKEEITAMMDEETFLFGPEIVDAGFIDSIVEGTDVPDAEARLQHLAVAKESFEACMTRIQTEEADEYEQIAAFLPEPKGLKKEPVMRGGTQQGVQNMEPKEILAQHPVAYTAIIALGVAQERDNVLAHLTMGEASGDMATAVTAIKGGQTMTAALTATYLAASMNRAGVETRTAEEIALAAAADGAAADDKLNGAADAVLAVVEDGLGLQGEA